MFISGGPVDNWKGDNWDRVSNEHLLAHIRRMMTSNSQHYGLPASYKRSDASPEFIANVTKLVSAKTCWAADMRDLDKRDGSGVPIEVQQRTWNEYVTAAEEEIAAAREIVVPIKPQMPDGDAVPF